MDIAIDSNDDVYILGYTTQEDEYYDIVLLKYNKTGHLIREQILGEEPYMDWWKLAIDTSNNVYIGGPRWYSDTEFLAKLNPEGNVLWNLTLSCELNSISTDSLNNIYLTSYIDNDNVIIKLNSSGSQLWNFTWEPLKHIEYADFKIDHDDNLIIAGSSGTYPFTSYIAKFNSSGNKLWNITQSNMNTEYFPQKLAIDHENSLICVSYKELFKINSSGHLIWSHGYSGYDFYVYMDVDSEGNIYLVKNLLSGVPNDDHFFFDGITSIETCLTIFLTKFDVNGDFIWQKRCTGCVTASVSGIALDIDNNIYISGTLSADSIHYQRHDILLMKNPRNFQGLCIPIYYDIIFVLSNIVGFFIIYPSYKYFKKRKQNKDKGLFDDKN